MPIPTEPVFDYSSLFINVCCSIAASFIFLFLALYFLRPRVKISPFVVKRAGLQEREEPGNVFVFKFYNSSWYSAFDVKIELFLLQKIPKGNGNYDNRYKPLMVKQNTLSYVAPRYFCMKDEKSTAAFAILCKTFENIEEHVGNEMFVIQLQITLRHGLSGLSRVYKKDFALTEECVVKGRFKHGANLDVIKAA